MADDYEAKKVEVAGQIVCELIRKDILPQKLRGGTMTIEQVASVFGALYQLIWKAIDGAPKTQ